MKHMQQRDSFMTTPAGQLAHRADALPRHSPRLLALFARYVRVYIARHFNALRLLRGSDSFLDELPADARVIFYMNHPSWWDPLVLIMLATQRFPTRDHFAPMDAAMLRKYAFFERLGFFGIEQDSAAGAMKMMRSAQAILAQPGSMLWITAEGRFTDVRSRPVELRPGLAHLARKARHAWLVPIAIEYPFWHERLPEALMAVGKPIAPASGDAKKSIDAWQHELSSSLQHTMDQLAIAAAEKDAKAFENLLQGKQGVGGVYDLWRRMRSLATGKTFHAAHHQPHHDEAASQHKGIHS